jgi:hypothetical protein
MRLLAAVRLFPVLALLSPMEVVAGPPQGVKGAMTFDAVADGLRKYAKETDQAKRIRWLERLGPTGDPRVAVALGEVIFDDPSEPAAKSAAILLAHHFAPPTSRRMTRSQEIEAGLVWWLENRDDLRRRASQMP